MRILVLKCKLPHHVLPHAFNEMKSYLHIGIEKTGSFAILFLRKLALRRGLRPRAKQKNGSVT